MRKTKQRRALSTARGGGRIDVWGEQRISSDLAAALRRPEQDRSVADSLTHRIHSYPAQLHPLTARVLVNAAAEPRSVVLDPFCGAGTVLVEARYHGARALGVDLNPLAVAIARAKTWTAPREKRRGLRTVGKDIATAAVGEGRAARRSGHRAPDHRTPRGADSRTRDRRIGEWFAPHVRRELEFIAAAIDEVRAREPDIANVLMVVLSSVLYKVSRRASDTDNRRFDRNVARGAAARHFSARLEQLCKGLSELAGASQGPIGEARTGDARNLGAAGIGRASIDAIITSPPYAGTYDYVDQHQLRLDFLGLSGADFKQLELGSRRAYTGNADARRRAHRQWQRDLGKVFAHMARSLKHGGRLVIVMGDSVAGGKTIFADRTIPGLVGDDLKLIARASQTRPTLGAMERRAFGTDAKREHIFWLERP